ncbi:MAG: hypothetical protein KOO69_07425 [Victivallales bacterium]|nr:hypothetical protein [Victivallales bacterium]
MTTLNSQNFKIGPCAVIFKGEILGMTQNSSLLEFQSTYHDSKCSQGYNQAIEKHLTSMTILLTAEIMSVDNGLGLFLDENDRISLDRLGERQSPMGGELLLIPISPSDMVAYRFPLALLLRNSKCAINANEEHSIQLEFEANFQEEEQILFERIPVDEAQRVTVNTTSNIDPAAFERAMTYYIADKLNMTVDTDIFRGGIPVNIDGCGVALLGQEMQNSVSNPYYEISFVCLDDERDKVMKTIHDLMEHFPVYGESVSVDGTGEVVLKAILKESSKFNREVTDNGKLKTLGNLSLIVVI